MVLITPRLADFASIGRLNRRRISGGQIGLYGSDFEKWILSDPDLRDPGFESTGGTASDKSSSESSSADIFAFAAAVSGFAIGVVPFCFVRFLA